MPTESTSKSAELWNDALVAEILADGHTKALFFTDRKGRIVMERGAVDQPEKLGERFDVLLASITHSGAALNLGELRFGVAIYSDAVVLAGTTTGHNVVLVAAPEANIGQLLSQARSLCSTARQD